MVGPYLKEKVGREREILVLHVLHLSVLLWGNRQEMQIVMTPSISHDYHHYLQTDPTIQLTCSNVICCADGFNS